MFDIFTRSKILISGSLSGFLHGPETLVELKERQKISTNLVNI
jgi:hypothetical protein